MPWHTRTWQALTGKGRRPEPWGAGIVDEGSDLLGVRTRWDEVAADELVHLMPGLPREHSGARLAPILAEALARREADPLGDDPAVRGHAVAWLRAARRAVESGEAVPAQPGFLEAACLGWETGVNGGYLVPEANLLHETLAAAAWLGHVCRGRDALLTRFVQPVLAERLVEAETSEGSSPSSLVSLYLSLRVRQAGLGSALRKAARDLAQHEAPVLVRATIGLQSSCAVHPGLRDALTASTARLARWETESRAGRRA